jgi:serine/threonine-protein kinase
VLLDEDQPRDIAERLALAQLCYDTKRYSAAARFWGEALQADPKLAEDREACHRYNAACAAALAGCGPGKDDPPLDETARAKLRVQAREWLAAELSAWSKLIESGSADERKAGVQAIRHWQKDADLAGVRDGAGLKALPEDERKAWQAVWAEADRLLKKAGKGDGVEARSRDSDPEGTH